MKTRRYLYFVLPLILITFSCKKEIPKKEKIEVISLSKDEESLRSAIPLSEEFKDYWYANEAEITSYTLEQARYGEIRQGSAVLVFVTEPFLEKEHVKANQSSSASRSILKLNATKNFHTGIYPYSIMQSVFYPVSNNQHALKISSSIQEWCGQNYTQLNNRSSFEVTSHSYFEGEADEDFSLNKAILENEIWTQLRIDPKSLSTGNLDIIPSFEYLRLQHIPLKAYAASAELLPNTYTISYADLNRSLSIHFNPEFPYDIISWEETYINGYGENAHPLTTKANRIKLIKSDYWNKSRNEDFTLRESLGLN